jgi:hypothetical protein
MKKVRRNQYLYNLPIVHSVGRSTKIPNGEVHHRYFKRWYYFVVPSSLLLCTWDWKFGAGNLVGYLCGRYL